MAIPTSPWPAGSMGHAKEQSFIAMVMANREIGYGRMIQIIETVWLDQNKDGPARSCPNCEELFWPTADGKRPE